MNLFTLNLSLVTRFSFAGALLLSVSLLGCGGGSSNLPSSTATPIPTATSVPTPTPIPTAIEPVAFNMTATPTGNYNSAFYYAVAGTRRVSIEGDQLIISAEGKNPASVRSTFTVTLPSHFKTGEAIGPNAVYTSAGDGLNGIGSWMGTGGKIVIESRTSTSAILRFTNVIASAQGGSGLYKASGIVTFNGTITVQLP